MIKDKTMGACVADNYGCPTFQNFLEESIGDKNSIAALQEFMGYCMVPKILFGKSLVISGGGSSGKTLLCRIIQNVVGAKYCSHLTSKDLSSVFELAKLPKKRVNFMDVTKGGLNIPMFKALVSGDPVLARHRHQENFIFKPVCKMVMSCNKIPSWGNRTEIGRWIIHIKMNPPHDGRDVDPFLADKIQSELKGVLRFSMAGLKRLLKNRKFTGQD